MALPTTERIRDLATVRDEISNGALIGFTAVGLPALGASLYRVTSIGWQPVMTLHLLLGLVVLSITVARRRLPYRVRGCVVVLLALASGLGGLLQFGLVSGGMPFLVVAPVLGTVLFGLRGGLWTSGFTGLSIAGIGLHSVLSSRLPSFDLAQHASDPRAWAVVILPWCVAVVGLVVATELSNRHLVVGLEQRIRLLLESTGDGVVGINAAGRMTFVNPAGARMLGGAPEGLIGGPIRIDDDHILRRDGTSVPVEQTRSPMTDNDEDGAVVVFHDVTERQRAERVLRESEERFRTLADASPAAISLFQDERLRYVNAAWAAFTGFSRQEALSIDPGVLFDAGARDEIFRRGKARLQGEDLPARYEQKIVTKGGQVRWADLSAKVASYDGRPAILTVATDITARKEEEQEREERIVALRRAMAAIKPLEGILTLCSFCKKIRDEHGRWQPVDRYLHRHTNADISHGICPDCAKEPDPEHV